MATHDEIGIIWRMLRASYPSFGKDLTPEQLANTLTVYEQLLADLPADILRAAAVAHAGSSRWFPTIAELRTACGALMTPQLVPAIEAWGEVLRAVAAFCRYSNNGVMPVQQWSNPLIGRVVDGMGWLEICDSTNEVADRAHFVRAYEALVVRAHEDALMLPQVRETRDRLQGGRAGDVSGLFGNVAATLRLGRG